MVQIKVKSNINKYTKIRVEAEGDKPLHLKPAFYMSILIMTKTLKAQLKKHFVEGFNQK